MTATLAPRIDQRRDDRGQQVHPLLFGEARHRREERPVPRLEPELRRQRLLAPGPPFERRGCAVALGQRGVGLGVEERVVDAVQDPRELARVMTEQAVQPAAAARGQDLAGVGRADRGDAVGERDGAVHQVDLPVVGERAVVERRARQADAPEDVLPEHPLERQVVDGEDRLRSDRPRARSEVHRRDGRCSVPVVRVDDVRSAGAARLLPAGLLLRPDPGRHRERPLRHHGEADVVVPEDAVRVAVDPVAVEEPWVVEQVDPERADAPIRHHGLDHAEPALALLPFADTDRDGHVPPAQATRDGRHAIARGHDDDVEAEVGEPRGQTGDDISEAAGPGEALHLGRDHQHAQRPSRPAGPALAGRDRAHGRE